MSKYKVDESKRGMFGEPHIMPGMKDEAYFRHAPEIIRAAWEIHMGHERQMCALPAPVVADILQRKAQHGDATYYVCYADTDNVMCANDIVWSTGGAKVYGFVIDNVDAEELDNLDYAWEVRFRCNMCAKGQPHKICERPRAYRNGVPLNEAQYREMIHRLEDQKGLLDKHAVTDEDITNLVEVVEV